MNKKTTPLMILVLFVITLSCSNNNTTRIYRKVKEVKQTVPPPHDIVKMRESAVIACNNKYKKHTIESEACVKIVMNMMIEALNDDSE